MYRISNKIKTLQIHRQLINDIEMIENWKEPIPLFEALQKCCVRASRKLRPGSYFYAEVSHDLQKIRVRNREGKYSSDELLIIELKK